MCDEIVVGLFSVMYWFLNVNLFGFLDLCVFCEVFNDLFGILWLYTLKTSRVTRLKYVFVEKILMFNCGYGVEIYLV